jgi:hypothetical protein
MEPDAPKALIFTSSGRRSHVGALPLRLMRESQWNVINVAVTRQQQGRQPERLKELRAVAVSGSD